MYRIEYPHRSHSYGTWSLIQLNLPSFAQFEHLVRVARIPNSKTNIPRSQLWFFRFHNIYVKCANYSCVWLARACLCSKSLFHRWIICCSVVSQTLSTRPFLSVALEWSEPLLAAHIVAMVCLSLAELILLGPGSVTTYLRTSPAGA